MTANVMSFAQFAVLASGAGIIPVRAHAPMTARTQKEVSAALVGDIKRRFTTSTAPDGSAWRPLAFSRPRGGDKPLLDTGRLMASITSESSPTEVVVGTSNPGANLHNFGGTIRPRPGKRLVIPKTKEAVRAGSPRRMRGTKSVPLFSRFVDGRWVGHWALLRPNQSVTIPERRFMGVSEVGMREIDAILLDAAQREWQSGRG